MGPYLSTPITEKNTIDGIGPKTRYAATGMQGWRNSMEDAHIAEPNLEPNICCYGVFDGHGGKEISIFVANHFWQHLVANSKFQQNKIGDALQESFLDMDKLILTPEGKKEIQEIQGYGNSNEPMQTMAGTTAVVAVISGDKLVCGNAGDSRCVLGRSGTAIDMSIDHKPDMEEERARIYNAGAVIVEGRVNGNINLSRSIGDLEYKENPNLPPEQQAVTAYPEIKEQTLGPNDDFIIIACDGIWDVLTSQQCVDFVYARIKTKSLREITEDICDRCLASDVASSGGLGCDNMTVIVIALK